MNPRLPAQHVILLFYASDATLSGAHHYFESSVWPDSSYAQDAADGSGDIPLCTQSPAAEQVLEAPGVHEQAPNMTYGEELEQDVFPVVATGVVTYGSQTESTAEVEEVRLLTAQTPPVKQEQEQQQQSSSRVGGIPIVPFETPDVSLEFGGECSVPPSSHEVR